MAFREVSDWVMTRTHDCSSSAARNLRLAGCGVLAALVIVSIACAVRGTRPRDDSAPVLETREGLASFYGRAFHGKPTASGARFNMRAMVAAHPSYPFGTVVRVTNLRNRRSVVVRILDRGPVDRVRAQGVIIDLAQRAAEKLGFISEGRTRVRLDVLRWGAP
jgi:rare lipoprotein A